MRSALATDTLRTIRHSARRFLALAAICVLGTTMLIGLTIACEDLRLSADSFFDDQRLYDVSVQSTLGLTNEDVDALAALDDVDSAQGSWSETAYTEVGDARQSVSVSSIAKGGMNEPYLLEGRLPKDGGELATTSEYLEASGKRIGDTVTFGVDADASTWAADDASEHQREKAADLLDKIADDEDGKLTEDERKLLDDVTAADLARAAESDGIDLDRWADLSDNELTNLLTDAYEGRFDDIEADTGDSTELFARHTYTIVGEVIDPTSVAAKNGFRDDPERTLRVATEFPHITRTYYTARSRDIDIIRLHGSIEIAPILDLTDVIVDIVETGTTLKENGLEVLEEICPLSARVVVNQVSMKMENERITHLLYKLKGVIQK